MLKDKEKAAFLLLGKTLEGGWKVTKRFERTEIHTGGIYSCCYQVENEDGEIGFLKAIDYSDADKVSVDTIKLIQNITNAFEYERSILKACLDNGLNNIVRLIHSGGVEVEEAKKYPKVEYLILEHAKEGDVRNFLSKEEVNVAWKLKSLHQITKGLSQLHGINVAHQDIKPSNIINFDKNRSKLTDLGSACSRDAIDKELPEYLNKSYSGSFEYSPPELLYGYVNQSFEERRIACDLYLLGNMVVFYFTNGSMNFLLKSNLDRNLWWERPEMYGQYDYVKPFLIEAFEKSLEDLKSSIEIEGIKDKIEDIVRSLCCPDPSRRGHSKNLNQKYNKYGLNRFLTIFDRLLKNLPNTYI